MGRVAAERETEILNQFRHFRYVGRDILESSGNSELLICDVLGLDQGSLTARAVVDEEAVLLSLPTQLRFDLA